MAALLAMVLACAVILSSTSARARIPRCEISVDHKQGELRINNVVLPTFRLVALHKAIGKPNRTISVKSKVRFERFGHRGSRPSSKMVTVTNRHYVYDHLGLIFSTHNVRRWSRHREPERLYVVFRKKTTFVHKERPAVLPKNVFRGVLKINGNAVSSQNTPVPTGVGYQTEKFSLFGTSFSPTSRAAVIDSIYSYAGRPTIRIFLDNANNRRVAYIKLR